MTVKFFRNTKPSPRALLTIYLNDHLAASVAGLELVKRTRSSNSEQPLATFLDDLIGEFGQDRAALDEAVRLLGVPVTAWKQQAAYVAEKAGRAKFNGQLTGYSPLSRVVELEALAAAVAHKVSLWRSLEHLATTEFRLSTFDTQPLIDRADRQRAALEEHRIAAVATAMAGGARAADGEGGARAADAAG